MGNHGIMRINKEFYNDMSLMACILAHADQLSTRPCSFARYHDSAQSVELRRHSA
jgi:hypothetical protein